MKRSWPQGTKPCQVGGPLGAVVALQSICLMYLSVLQWHKNLPLHSNKEHLLTWSMCAHVWSPQIEICSIKTFTKLYMHTIIKQRIKCNIVSHYTHCLHKLHIKIIVKLSQEKKKIVICALAVDLHKHGCELNQLMEPVGIIISYSVEGGDTTLCIQTEILTKWFRIGKGGLICITIVGTAWIYFSWELYWESVTAVIHNERNGGNSNNRGKRERGRQNRRPKQSLCKTYF